MTSRRATMMDVARRAGVSHTTVARVIYRNGYVKRETKRLVEDAVAAIGFRPNVLARGLRTSRSFTIGMVTSLSKYNTFHTEVVQSAQIEALSRGYAIVSLSNAHEPDVESVVVRRLLDQHVDAVIFCTALQPENVRLAYESGTVVVQIERRSASVGSCVLVDYGQGMLDAVTLLAELGHQRIAFVGGDAVHGSLELPSMPTVEMQRLTAFRNALKLRGLEVDESLIQLGPYLREDTGPQPGFTLTKLLLDNPRPPTAIIYGADVTAAAGLQAVYQARLRVPDDISIVGHDDLMAPILTPALTTISSPSGELGTIAVQLAIRAIEGEETPGVARMLGTSLVVRASTARVRQ